MNSVSKYLVAGRIGGIDTRADANADWGAGEPARAVQASGAVSFRVTPDAVIAGVCGLHSSPSTASTQILSAASCNFASLPSDSQPR